MGEESCNLTNITTSLSGMNLDDEDYSSSSNVSSPSISSSPSSSNKSKKPRKNKPTNLILGNVTTPSEQPDTTIPTEIIKIAEEKYVDEAVKMYSI